MKHLTIENFEEEVLKSNMPVVLDFYADWCGPCRIMAPVFEELSEEMKNVKFLKVDTESQGGLAARFGVQGIPTLVILKNGDEEDRVVGMVPKEVLEKKIKQVL